MNKQAKRSTVGGQGVLGGVMMRSPKKAALAVRRQDGGIAMKTWEVEQKKSWFARLPVVRGVINFVDMLFTGVGVLMDAAKMSEEGTEEFEPSRFEKFVAGKLGKKAEDVMMFFAVAIALVLAVLLNRKIKGRAVYRTIFFLPMVAAPAAIAMVWRWLFNSEFGLLNHVFGTKINWISDPKIAVFAIGIIGVWSIIGYNMVLFISGLQEIPGDYYEAASIDGATGVKQFFKITIPLLSPTIFFVTITRVIGGLQVFDLIYMVMDKDNPALYKTQSLVYLFYQNSFVENNKGYGSTIVVLLLAIIMLITVFQMIAQKKWVHYN